VGKKKGRQDMTECGGGDQQTEGRRKIQEKRGIIETVFYAQTNSDVLDSCWL